MQKTLKEGLELLKIDTRLYEPLLQYCARIEEWNQVHSLVAASGQTLVVKHILDSLAALPVLRERLAESGKTGARSISVLDIGSGAGLPGIPLALAMPDFRFSLLERMGKRVKFLNTMKDELGLKNTLVLEQQAEHIKGRWDVITFRAWKPFEKKLFKKVFALCSADGFIMAYKGKAEKAQAELEELDGLAGRTEVIPIKVPFLDDERCLVFLSPKPSRR